MVKYLSLQFKNESRHGMQACQVRNNTRMWANAQRDGHRWRPLFNAAKFG